MPYSIYVGNLHPECTEATLFHKFSPIGLILHVRVCRDRDSGGCLGHGYITYAFKADAEKALETLNYDLLKGRPLRLMWKNSNKANQSANLFVKNIDFDVDEKTLVDVFGNYGRIVSLKVARNSSGASRGFGFVQFEEEESANAALLDLNEKLVLGRKLYVCKFIPRGGKVDDFNNIYLKNFQLSFRDQDLIEMCEKFGSIVSAKVMTDEEGNSKGFGFVCFVESDSAKEAVKDMNGLFLDGKRLFVGRAKKKSERQREMLESLKRKIQDVQP